MRGLGWLALPLVLLVALVAALIVFRPLDPLTAASPPVEEISFSRVRLDPGVISLTVTADGSQPVQDRAGAGRRRVSGLHDRSARPDRPARHGSDRHPVSLGRAARRTTSRSSLRPAPYSITRSKWREPSPSMSGESLALLVLVGLLLGVAPVAIGMFAYPGAEECRRRRHELSAGADGRAAPLPLHRHADGRF